MASHGFDILRYNFHGRPATRWLKCRIVFSAIFKLNGQKIVADQKISDIIVNPPLCRPGSPALGIESSESRQTHSSCRYWWRFGPCHHWDHLEHHHLECDHELDLWNWIILRGSTCGCWPRYGTLLESSCQRRMPKLYTSQALDGSSPFNSSGALGQKISLITTLFHLKFLFTWYPGVPASSISGPLPLADKLTEQPKSPNLQTPALVTFTNKVKTLCGAKVSRQGFFTHQNITGLYVQVNHLTLMTVLQSTGDLQHMLRRRIIFVS